MVNALCKSAIHLLIITLITTFISLGVVEEGQSEETPVLSIGKASFFKWKVSFYKSDQTVPPSPVADGIFRKGEQIIFILENIGTFKESNGEHWYYSDFSIETPEDESVFSKKGDLGDIVKDRLPNGILELYNISVNPEMIGIEAGKYVFKATIYDKIGGGEASVSKRFTIQHNDALKSELTPPPTVGTEATDKNFANGTIFVKGKNISIKHVYPYLAPNTFASMYPEKYKEKMDLQVLFSDNEVPEKAFPMDKDGNSELVDLMRAEKIHAFLIIFDRETKQMTTLAEEGAVYINDVQPGRFGMQGYYMVEYLKYGDKTIEGKFRMYEDVIDTAGWDFNVKFKVNLPPEVR